VSDTEPEKNCHFCQ